MEGRGRSRRRNVHKIWKQRLSAVMAVVLTAVMILNVPLSIDRPSFRVSDAFASGSDAERDNERTVWATASNAEYKQGKTQEVDIYVIAEDNAVVPGNMTSMTLYLKNNTEEEITDGVLTFKSNHIAKENGYFCDVQAEAEDSSPTLTISGSEENTIEADAALKNPVETAEEIDSSKGIVESADLKELFDLDDAEEETEKKDNEEEEEKLYQLTDIDLLPGELHEIEFDFYTEEDENSAKANVKFSFTGEGSEKKIRSEEKFYYSIGLPVINVELADGLELEAGVWNEMNIWMSEPDWVDEDLEEFMAEHADEEEEEESFRTASDSDAEKASDSNAEKASPSDAELEEAARQAAEEAKIEKFTGEAMEISESKVSYTVEIRGTEYQRFRPKKAESETDIGWISCLYEMAADTKPGIYYGKVTGSGKWNRKSFTSEQGFLFEVTGEGTIELSSRLDGSRILVTGPASSFPDADTLEIQVSEVTEEQKQQVDEALAKKAEEEGLAVTSYKALDIKLIADGEEVEPLGPISVSFENLILDEQADILDATGAEARLEAETETEEANAAAAVLMMVSDDEEEEASDNAAFAEKAGTSGPTGEIKVFHLDETENVVHEMDSNVEDNGNVVMTTDHFSIYIVVDSMLDLAKTVNVQVQHWAEIEMLENTLPLTVKGEVTKANGVFTADTAIDGNTGTIKHASYVCQIYSDDKYDLGSGEKLDLQEKSKLSGAEENYTVKGVYLLKSEKTVDDKTTLTEEEWEKESENWYDITNDYQTASAGGNSNQTLLTLPRLSEELGGYVEDEPYVIRFIYEPKTDFGDDDKQMPATFYDYDVYPKVDGQQTGYGMNEQTNFSGKEGNWLGFTNVAGVDHHYPTTTNNGGRVSVVSNFNHSFNAYGAGKSGYKAFVSELSDGNIVYNNKVVDQGLFDDTTINAEMMLSGYHLQFDRKGDTYILSGVTDEDKNNVLHTIYDSDKTLRQFVQRKNQWGSIWTNDFWVMDTNKMTEDYRSCDFETDKAHNWFFGMRYEFEFDLQEDYTGPLSYCFFGDDDFWLFVDDKLVVDLGGIHDPLGRRVNLYDFLKDDNDNIIYGKHHITILYLERGGEASTCYMEFTIPNIVPVEPLPGQERTSITATKVWKDAEGNDLSSALIPDDVKVQLYYQKDGEKSEELTRYGAEVTLNAANNWTCTWSNMPKEGYKYQVVETEVDGFTTTYSNVDTDAFIKLSSDGEYKVTITNQLGTENLQVKKTWKNADSITNKSPVKIGVYWSGTAVDGTEVQDIAYQGVNGNFAQVTLNGNETEGDAWSKLFVDLPLRLEYEGKVYGNIQYTVKELDDNNVAISDGGYLTTSDGSCFQVTYARDESAEDAKNMPVITVTNTLKVYNLTIQKVDSTDSSKSLSGAVFSLQKASDTGGTSKVSRTTGNDGKAVFENLNPGSYTLTETTAPAGYHLPGNTWTVTIANDGTISMVVSGTETPVSQSETGEFVITNTPGVELPVTGGPGTELFRRYGLMLLALSAWMLCAESKLYSNKKRKEDQ